MSRYVGSFLLWLGKQPGFKNFVIGLLVSHPWLMTCVDAATEIYKSVKDVTDDGKSSDRAA